MAFRFRAFRVLVDGAPGTGKSSFAQRHCAGAFEDARAPSTATEVYPLMVYTTSGPVLFDVWVMPGDERYARPMAFYECAQALLAFFDATRPETIGPALAAIAENPGLLSVLCGNKADAGAGAHCLRVPGSPSFTAFTAISVKTGYNVDAPFLALARGLMGDPALEYCQTASPLGVAPGGLAPKWPQIAPAGPVSRAAARVSKRLSSKRFVRA